MPSNSTDAIALLQGDHRRGDDGVRRLGGSRCAGRKRTLAEQIRMELMIHGLFGDEVFYPSRQGKAPISGEPSVECAGTRVLLARIKAEGAPAIPPFTLHSPTQGTLID